VFDIISEVLKGDSIASQTKRLANNILSKMPGLDSSQTNNPFMFNDLMSKAKRMK
jgi:hypothetical protein